jgi:hypothetical protein
MTFYVVVIVVARQTVVYIYIYTYSIIYKHDGVAGFNCLAAASPQLYCDLVYSSTYMNIYVLS